MWYFQIKSFGCDIVRLGGLVVVLSNWEFWWWYCWIESFGCDIVRLGDLVVVLSIESFGVVLSDSEIWLWYCQLGVLVVVLSN